jgi:hypothetical protein
MDALERFLLITEVPEVEASYVDNGKQISIESYSFCGHQDEDEFRIWLNGLYDEAIKIFTSRVKELGSSYDQLSYIASVLTRIKQALPNYYYIKKQFETLNREIIQCRSLRWVIVGMTIPEEGFDSNEEDLLNEPFLRILKKYGERFDGHIENFKTLLPLLVSIPETSSPVEDKSTLPKWYWGKKKTNLVELIWLLVETDCIYKDSKKQVRVDKNKLYSFFGKVFSVDMKNPEESLEAAFKRKNKYGNAFLNTLNDEFLKEFSRKDELVTKEKKQK